VLAIFFVPVFFVAILSLFRVKPRPRPSVAQKAPVAGQEA
jgi:hypothetical protein